MGLAKIIASLKRKTIKADEDLPIEKTFSTKQAVQSITISSRGAFQNIANVFDDVAKQILQEVHPFSNKEKDEILYLARDYIENARQEAFDNLWNNYFASRQWVWDEFEFWRSLALNGQFIPFFTAERNTFRLEKSEEVFELLSLQKIKTMLVDAGLEAPNRDVKKWAVNVLAQSAELFEKVKIQCTAQQKQKEVRLLIQTIRDRSKNLATVRLADSVELQSVDKYAAPCIEIATKRNPNAIPPFWPGSIITYRGIFKEFDEA